MATWTTLPAGVSVVSVQATTEVDPSSIAEGQPLANVGGFHLYVRTDPGQTFVTIDATKCGDLAGFITDDKLFADWAYTPDVSFVIPASCAGRGFIAFSGWTVDNPRGRIAHVAKGVGTTSGGLTLTYSCTMLKGFNI